MPSLLRISVTTIILPILIGCASVQGKPVLPVELPGNPISQQVVSSDRLLWGMWDLCFNPDRLTVSGNPRRTVQTHFNITPLFQPPYCDDCVTIVLNSFNPVTRMLDVDLTLKNPYPVSGYDVRTIVYTNDDGPLLYNADDWTELFDIPGGYEINPFRAYAKGESGRVFSDGASHSENFLIYVPDPPNWPTAIFAVDASLPGNCEEPYSIDSVTQTGTLFNFKGSTVNLQAEVYDWQINVGEVALKAPEITGEEFSPFTHLGGNSWAVELTNNTGAPAGKYNVRIKADSGASSLYDIVQINISGGISGDYPGDVGIENDSSVIFVENFEEGSLEELFSIWEEVKNPDNMTFSDHSPPGCSGSQSLLVTHTGGQGNGAHLYRRLLPGYDRLYIRFYVKFDPDCGPIHHFFHAGGYNPSTPWPQGGAGEKPNGDERFTTGVEPFGNYDPWRWDFYTYWMEMRICPAENYWGNDFINDPDLEVEMGTWICHELMMKMNDPVTEPNGEMALWINGQLRFKDGQCISYLGEGYPNGEWVWDSFIPDPGGEPFGGFRWRSDVDLNINFLWLLTYITQADAGHVSRIWFDQVVVADEYIGPINPY